MGQSNTLTENNEKYSKINRKYQPTNLIYYAKYKQINKKRITNKLNIGRLMKNHKKVLTDVRAISINRHTEGCLIIER